MTQPPPPDASETPLTKDELHAIASILTDHLEAQKGEEYEAENVAFVKPLLRRVGVLASRVAIQPRPEPPSPTLDGVLNEMRSVPYGITVERPTILAWANTLVAALRHVEPRPQEPPSQDSDIAQKIQSLRDDPEMPPVVEATPKP